MLKRSQIILSLFAVLVVLAVLMPRTAKFSYEYKKGAPWKYETLVAQFDFPILKSDEQLMDEMLAEGKKLVPYFKYSPESVSDVRKALEELDYSQCDPIVRNVILNSAGEIYDKGIVSDKTFIAEGSDVIFVQKDKRAVKLSADNVYTLQAARMKLDSDLSAALSVGSCDTLLAALGVYDALVADLIYDRQTTELVHAESENNVSPTSGYVRSGELIVSNGEIVTSEISQMLDSYKHEYEAEFEYDGPLTLFWAGNALVSLIMVLLLFFAIYLTDPKIFQHGNQFFYILFVYLIFAIVTLLLVRYEPDMLITVPFALAALYLQSFFRSRLIIPVYVTILIPLLIFSQTGVMQFVISMAAGIVAIYSYRYFYKGWKQFITALLVFVAMAVVYLGFRFADIANGRIISDLVMMFIAALLTVFCYPLIYLFEKIFNLISDSRLLELSDTSNPLLRDLELKAPGTFQHSLQVMNMSDAAARSIGANALLVKAGALYHDIGKMLNPQCFVENESLMTEDEKSKYHSQIGPLQSSHDIIKHVEDGLDLARKNHLPGVVQDFIRSHHGTTQTAFFYNRYLEQGGEPSGISEFTYPGPKPQTKEQIILMLCDTIEAASRTLKDYTPESYSKFVEDIVMSKMSQGQFDEAGITYKELGIVKEEIKTYLAMIYHERVAYPMRKR